MYSGTSCDGDREGAAGIVTYTCIKYGSYGLMFTCDETSTSVNYYYWKDNTCSGTYAYSGSFTETGNTSTNTIFITTTLTTTIKTTQTITTTNTTTTTTTT